MNTIAKVDLAVGQKVLLAHAAPPNRKWEVQAVNDRFVVLTQQRPFHPRGEVQYTIIDWDRGVRGPCNLIGQGWTFHVESLRQDAEKLLDGLQAHREFLANAGPRAKVRLTEQPFIEVSYRNNVPIGVTVVS